MKKGLLVLALIVSPNAFADIGIKASTNSTLGLFKYSESTAIGVMANYVKEDDLIEYSKLRLGAMFQYRFRIADNTHFGFGPRLLIGPEAIGSTDDAVLVKNISILGSFDYKLSDHFLISADMVPFQVELKENSNGEEYPSFNVLSSELSITYFF